MRLMRCTELKTREENHEVGIVYSFSSFRKLFLRLETE